MEGLAVGDHQADLFAQEIDRSRQFLGLDHHRTAVAVQKFPDGLLLGQDQPALGGRFIAGDHQYHQGMGFQQVQEQGLLLFFLTQSLGNPFLQFPDPGAGTGTD